MNTFFHTETKTIDTGDHEFETQVYGLPARYIRATLEYEAGAIHTSDLDLYLYNHTQERNPDEVSFIEGVDHNDELKKIRITPEGSIAKNYAFDVTPSKYITKLITEKGNIEANTNEIEKLKK